MQATSSWPVYLNTAAASLNSPRVLHTIQTHLQLESECGAYVAAESAQAQIVQCRANIARMLNCTPAEIALTDSASRAWHRVLDCFDFQPGDVVMVSPTVWGGNYFSLLQLQDRLGIQVQCMPCDVDGVVDLDHLGQQLGPKVKLMELTLAPSGWDTWQPSREIAQLARLHSIPLVMDASQAVGQREIDVAALNCDFLFASGRKWLGGPCGTGVLYVNQASTAHLCPLGLDQHTGFLQGGQLDWVRDARRFELSERSVALQLGLRVAVDETIQHLQNGQSAQLTQWASEFRQSLSRIPGVRMPVEAGDLGDLGAIVTFRHETHSAVFVRDFLRRHRIEVGVHPRTYMPLHPPTQVLGDCVRISPGSAYARNASDALSHFLEKLSSL